ncbi:Periplasmic protease [Thermoanaerobacter thermohydrosulfuricus WC1]|uniref:Periplasmic protease n=1 Tax=Thermoanaerobacter thermohydrosulfuricus WC1 TaxID=1198630 RepID=M8CZ95_THETY|nr:MULTISPECIES: S41 family peptidase [Thermoanaerobacter]EMT39633.1 Periplasmic protease [Thermoanaerobacter thermohydrosulfuricus WC1]
MILLSKKLSISMITLIFLLILIFSTGFFTGIYTSNTLFASKELKDLTEKEKIEDFEYMYNILKDNYAHFYEVKKMYGYDWLAHKEEFIEEIKNTRNNIEFYNKLNEILGKLHDGHLYVASPSYFNYFLKLIEDEAIRDFVELKPFIKIFKDSKKNYEKWSELLGSVNPNYNSSFFVQMRRGQKNIKTEILEEDKIAYLRVNSFLIDKDQNSKNYREEKKEIYNFLKTIKDYPYLIIDISGNVGGSSEYWIDAIVAPLIGERGLEYLKLEYLENEDKNTYFYLSRKGNYTQKNFGRCVIFYDEDKFRESPIYDKLSEEMKKDFTIYEFKENLFKQEEKYIEKFFKSNEYVNFKGKIFLIIDRATFSAATEFAKFCKETGFATLVGRNTLGHGSLTSYMRLPNSGLIVRFEAGTILNRDGGSFFIEGVKPDIELDVPDTNAGYPEVRAEILKQKTVELIKSLGKEK